MARKTLNGRNMAGTKITGLAPGTASTDAATKGQLDTAIEKMKTTIVAMADVDMARPDVPWDLTWVMLGDLTPKNARDSDPIVASKLKDNTPLGPSGTTNDWRNSTLLLNGAPMAENAELASWPASVGGVPFVAPTTSGAKPTVVTIGGRRYVVTDGIDDSMKAATGAMGQSFSIIVIGRQLGDVSSRSTSRVVIASASTVSPYRAAFIQAANSQAMRMYAGANANLTDTTPTGTSNDVTITADNEYHLFGLKFDGASSVGIRDGLRVPVASGSTLTFDPGTEGFDGLMIGANGALNAFSNFAYERIIVGTFTASDIAAWRARSDVIAYYGW